MLEQVKTRSDALSEEVKEMTRDCYVRPDVSSCMPDKKKTKGGKPCYIMQSGLSHAYKTFNAENPGIMKKSKFAALRPRNVKHAGNHQLVQCLCPYCTNIELKLQSLNKKIEDVAHKIRQQIRCSKQNDVS